MKCSHPGIVFIVIIAAAVLPLLAGCASSDPHARSRGPVDYEHGPLNAAMIHAYHQQAIDNAVIRQHTIHPYHFIANSAELNDLGLREVHVLAHHYAQHPGALNVHRGTADDNLYDERVEAIRLAMLDAGVSPQRLRIDDDMPGGDGLSGTQVVIITERTRQPRRGATMDR